MNQTLADAGHTLVSAGAFVFDDDVMAGTQMDKDGVQIQVNIHFVNKKEALFVKALLKDVAKHTKYRYIS